MLAVNAYRRKQAFHTQNQISVAYTTHFLLVFSIASTPYLTESMNCASLTPPCV